MYVCVDLFFFFFIFKDDTKVLEENKITHILSVHDDAKPVFEVLYICIDTHSFSLSRACAVQVCVPHFPRDDSPPTQYVVQLYVHVQRRSSPPNMLFMSGDSIPPLPPPPPAYALL